MDMEFRSRASRRGEGEKGRRGNSHRSFPVLHATLRASDRRRGREEEQKQLIPMARECLQSFRRLQGPTQTTNPPGPPRVSPLPDGPLTPPPPQRKKIQYQNGVQAVKRNATMFHSSQSDGKVRYPQRRRRTTTVAPRAPYLHSALDSPNHHPPTNPGLRPGG